MSARIEDLSRPSGALLAATQVDDCAQIELAGDVGQRPGVDNSRTQLGELALGEIRIGDEKVLGHDQPKDRVTEEFQTLVGGEATLLVRVRPVCQGAIEQLRINTHPELS